LNKKDFIAGQVFKLKNRNIKIFPEQFCSLSHSTELNLPDKYLVLGKDFFGSFEITTTSGEPVLNVESESKAKFVVYSSRRRWKQIKIPKDEKTITESVKNYETYLDELLTEIKIDFKKENFEPKHLGIVSGEIFKKLNLTRL
jgi:hypothetical protein